MLSSDRRAPVQHWPPLADRCARIEPDGIDDYQGSRSSGGPLGTDGRAAAADASVGARRTRTVHDRDGERRVATGTLYWVRRYARRPRRRTAAPPRLQQAPLAAAAGTGSSGFPTAPCSAAYARSAQRPASCTRSPFKRSCCSTGCVARHRPQRPVRAHRGRARRRRRALRSALRLPRTPTRRARINVTSGNGCSPPHRPADPHGARPLGQGRGPPRPFIPTGGATEPCNLCARTLPTVDCTRSRGRLGLTHYRA